MNVFFVYHHSQIVICSSSWSKKVSERSSRKSHRMFRKNLLMRGIFSFDWLRKARRRHSNRWMQLIQFEFEEEKSPSWVFQFTNLLWIDPLWLNTNKFNKNLTISLHHILHLFFFDFFIGSSAKYISNDGKLYSQGYYPKL